MVDGGEWQALEAVFLVTTGWSWYNEENGRRLELSRADSWLPMVVVADWQTLRAGESWLAMVD